MEKRWVLKNKPDKEVVEQLSKELNIGKVLSELLVLRGINTFEEARSFFRPQLSGLIDPFLMKDMDKAVERIELAKELGEKIMVYGDYDVDGTTAVSIVYSFLKNSHKKLIFTFPTDTWKDMEYPTKESILLLKMSINFLYLSIVVLRLLKR